MAENYLQLNDISSYGISFGLSNHVWDIVIKWDNFAKNTVGSQFARAIDSISANIAECFGRYGKKDKIFFYRIARASAYESLDWLEKCNRRGLVAVKEYEYMLKILKEMPKEINALIKFTNNNLAI